jgi:Domain of unknown function (DUF4276)
MKQKKIKIGIVGENPVNDAATFRTLLNKRGYKDVQFVIVGRNLEGGQLDNTQALIRRLLPDIKSDNLAFIIVVRDLDGILEEKEKVRKRDEWFAKINKGVDSIAIFYLAIAEMEALLLADVDQLNAFFKLKLPKYNNPIAIQDPKRELKLKTAKSKKPYTENMCNDIMEKISFDSVFENHKGDRSFQDFIKKLDGVLIENLQ